MFHIDLNDQQSRHNTCFLDYYLTWARLERTSDLGKMVLVNCCCCWCWLCPELFRESKGSILMSSYKLFTVYCHPILRTFSKAISLHCFEYDGLVFALENFSMCLWAPYTCVLRWLKFDQGGATNSKTRALTEIR